MAVFILMVLFSASGKAYGVEAEGKGLIVNDDTARARNDALKDALKNVLPAKNNVRLRPLIKRDGG
jgi:hypothetical protein